MKKQKLKAFICLLLIVSTLLTMAIPASASNPALPNGVYVLYAINKTHNMNVLLKKGVGASIGTDYANGESNESWILERVGITEYFTLRPWHQKNCYLSGKNGKGNGLTLEQGIPSSRNCQWKAIYIGNHQYVIANRANPSLVIDCTNGHINSLATPYILWDRNGYAEAQSFYPVRISERTDKIAPSNRISPAQVTSAFGASSKQNMVLNAQFARGVGASIVLDNLSSPAESNETVTLIPRGNNLYSMHFAHSPDTAIAASDIFTDSPLTLKKFNSSDFMCLWEVYQVGSGYSFRNAGNLLMFDNYCHGSHAGNPQICYSYTGGDPQVYFKKAVSSASSSSVSSNSSAENVILQRLNNMMNGTYANGLYKVNTRYCGTNAHEQCKGFMKDVGMELFGFNIGSTCSKPYNYKIDYSNKAKLVGTLTNLPSKSNSTIRSLFDAARAGDFIQLRRSHGGSHSMVFLYSDSNSVTVLEANVDNNNTIQKNTYSWAKFRSDNSAVSVYTAKNYKLK